MFNQDAIVIIKANDFIIFIKDDSIVCIKNNIAVLRANFTIQISHILFDFQNLRIFIIFKFKIIEKTNCRLLFFINVTEDIGLLNLLFLPNL